MVTKKRLKTLLIVMGSIVVSVLGPLCSSASGYILPGQTVKNPAVEKESPLGTRPLGLYSFEKMTPEGKYEIYVWSGTTWVQAGSLSYDRFLRERQIGLAEALEGQGETRIKIVQRGGQAAHIDSVSLGGRAPVDVRGIPEVLALKKISDRDFDVVDAFDKTVEVTFAAKGDGILRLVARVEGAIRNELSFSFPLENQKKEAPDSFNYYRYELCKADKACREPKLLFKEFSPTCSGHPAGNTYGWVGNDEENLYVRVDFTPDNTSDGDKDYTKVFVKTRSGVREFEVSGNGTKWGRAHFTYTDKVSYQHKVYEFKIPLAELGMRQGNNEETLFLAFSAYGTAAFSGDLNPSLAYDSRNNRYLIVYLKTDIGLTPHIYGQVLGCDGTSWGEEFRISQGHYNKWNPSVAYDPVNERFLVVWEEFQPGTGYDILGQMVHPGGTLIGSNFSVSDAYGGQHNARVGYGQMSGRFLVVWEDHRAASSTGSNIYGQFVNPDGTLYGVNFPISEAVGDQRRPSLAYDHVNDRFLVVWGDGRRGDSDVYGQMVGDSGLVGSNFIITDAYDDQSSPSVAYNGVQQRFLVVWGSFNPSTSYDIYGQFVNPNGTLYGVNFPISVAVDDQKRPSVAYDTANRRFVVVWEDNRSGVDTDIYARYLNEDGTFNGSELAISSAPNDQITPAVAYNTMFSNFLVCWESRISGEISISDVEVALLGPPCVARTLAVSKAGSGSGQVTSDPPGIYCGEDCQESYAQGATVMLTAIPLGLSVFGGWSGDCTDIGMGRAQVIMDGDKTCTATFNLASGPDLTGSWGGSKVYNGSLIVGKLRINNVGDRWVMGGFWISFYVSDDERVDAFDTLVGMAHVRRAIRPGSRRNVVFSFWGGPFVSGKYVIALIDSLAQIPEVDETNNDVVWGPLP